MIQSTKSVFSLRKFAIVWRVCLGLVLFTSYSVLHSQTVPNDEKAKELMILGKQNFRAGKYSDAAQKFELVIQRDFNRFTTGALYYAGLSYYFNHENVRATDKFDELEKKYPESKYIENAKYHQALMELESPGRDARERGLDKLFKILTYTRDQKLKDDVLSTLRHHLFNVFSIDFVRQYKLFVIELNQWVVVEAICAHLDKKTDGDAIREEIQQFEAKGGKLTDYLTALKKKYAATEVVVTNTGELRIAVMLGFNLNQADTSFGVPKATRRALEYYEGMLLAVDSLAATTDKKITMQVFDTRGDSGVIRMKLDEVREFRPNVIIGEISTSLAQTISAWAEKNHVVQLIPKNPLDELITNKKFVFLVHPSVSTHGRAMADFMYREGKRNIAIWDESKVLLTNRFASSFKNQLIAKGDSTFKYITLPKDFFSHKAIIPGKVLETSLCDAAYIPLLGEESAGLILAEMKKKKLKYPVYGPPDWEAFNTIDGDIKTEFQLKYSTFYFDQSDSLAFGGFYKATLNRFLCPPSQYHVQGYDIMSWLIAVSKDMNSTTPLADAIRKAQPWKGIHQEFFFDGKQDNQRPTIVRFEYGRLYNANEPQH